MSLLDILNEITIGCGEFQTPVSRFCLALLFFVDDILITIPLLRSISLNSSRAHSAALAAPQRVRSPFLYLSIAISVFNFGFSRRSAPVFDGVISCIKDQ